ncbi:MAG: FecR domain-containing protein [Sphingobacteriales bacterium]|nr:FecR domain-containing protein [Sphingobacteriales bacterium]OJY81059.1 MAG: hypothetical protein BGP14_07490 [Sphingobacteriales bacterium 44-15]
MDNNRLRQLLALYFNNTIEREDCEELLQYLDEMVGDSGDIPPLIDECLSAIPAKAAFSQERREQVYEKLITDINRRSAVNIPKVRRIRWIHVAAILIVTISLALLIYRNTLSFSNEHLQIAKKEPVMDIVLPEGHKAILTLANGRTIIVNDSINGTLASEDGVAIRHTTGGKIEYDAGSSTIERGKVSYNTFSTPKGQSYELSLPDGTEVWLNSSSSLRFPVAFTGKERRVTLTGEAYFEVAKVTGKTFHVEANGSTVEVTGTHFNVSAYQDEAQVTTTLIEGSVNVSKNKETVTLKPGRQAVVHSETGRITQSDADIRSVLAWKNGYFRFDDETIKSIITKISRWYDIEEVEYQGQFSDRFTGTFHRSKGVSQLFSHLEKLAPVRFEIKERRVIVMR